MRDIKDYTPERRALQTHKMVQRAKWLSVSMMFQLLCGMSDLATARRVLEHDDPKWQTSEIGYTVIAPMQGYAQLAEMETDVDAFSNKAVCTFRRGIVCKKL